VFSVQQRVTFKVCVAEEGERNCFYTFDSEVLSCFYMSLFILIINLEIRFYWFGRASRERLRKDVLFIIELKFLFIHS